MTEEEKAKIPEIFQYTKPVLPEDCIHSISPSAIDKFFSCPVLYYNENVLNNEQQFQGNTSTTTGSICHHIYKCVTEKKEINRETINKQLNEFHSLRPELELDIIDITNSYPQISQAVVNKYIIPHDAKGSLIKCEQQIVAKVDDGIYVAGTYDRLEGDCIVDYKNVGTKPGNLETIPFNYKIQLLAYAWALRKKGHEVNRIRLVYGVKPTKTLPARCYVVTEQIDHISDKLIDDTLRLIAESVTICKNRPELTYLIFKSYNLKGVNNI